MSQPAALYARVSSDRQREQETIASQTAALQAYAVAHDYVVPREWIDDSMLVESTTGSTSAQSASSLRLVAAGAAVGALLVGVVGAGWWLATPA